MNTPARVLFIGFRLIQVISGGNFSLEMSLWIDELKETDYICKLTTVESSRSCEHPKKTSMLKTLFPISALVLCITSCSTMKPVVFNRQSPPQAANDKKEPKFLDIDSDNSTVEISKEAKSSGKRTESPDHNASSRDVAKGSSLQSKYAHLLNTDADQVQNMPLYQSIDEWYGTPYKYGGSTKDGIDCSAFVQTIFASAFAISLPRTAREQYSVTRHISRTELQEGDLLFFNTQGGVSHVGIYLQNNKFVHASVTGVTISDMFEPYYVRHFVAAGRVDKKASAFENSKASAAK
jgi:lipoprotein Spr